MTEVPKQDDRAPGGDDVLADLERMAEVGDAPSPSRVADADVANHQRAYALIDELAAPIRFALQAHDSTPNLRDYGELEEIGRGGMGVVYRGFHQKMQRTDAIKVVRPDRLAVASPEMVRQLQFRFEQESKLAARVAHEHIVPVYQVGEVNGHPWFSMQLVHGRSLQDLSRCEALSCERVVRYLERIARAVDAVHRHGVLHGDIKPHNILIESETDRPLITDFGLADFMACRNDGSSSGVAGTPAYMAPELARAAHTQQAADAVGGDLSIASDVYSLGKTLWSVLTRSFPIDAEDRLDAENSPSDGIPVGDENSVAATGRHASANIPPPLRQICAKAQSEDPADRHASAREFADALSAWLDRPRWNRHFPMLRPLLWMVLAPVLLVSGFVVFWLLKVQAAEVWVWLAVFLGYLPLFGIFLVSQKPHRDADPARREIWAVWLGHFAGSVACMIALRMLCHPDLSRTMWFFYPCWAAISSVVFFAKSANFWGAYRWIGSAWFAVAILLAATPGFGPILFGVLAAITAVVIAMGDRAFVDE